MATFCGVFFLGGGGGWNTSGLMIYIPFDALINHVETRFKRFRVDIVFLIHAMFFSYSFVSYVNNNRVSIAFAPNTTLTL